MSKKKLPAPNPAGASVSKNNPPELALMYQLIDLANRRKFSQHKLKEISEDTFLQYLEEVSKNPDITERAFWQEHLELVEAAQAASAEDLRTDPLGMALWFYAGGDYDQASALLRRVRGQFPQ